MSWSFTFETASGETARHDAGQAWETYVAGLPETDRDFPERDDQCRAAIAAAELVLGHGAGPVGAGPYRVSFSGHANPGHQDREGWAKDILSVHVARI